MLSMYTFSFDFQDPLLDQNPQHQRRLEAQARDNFYADGGDRNAYLAFLPFEVHANPMNNKKQTTIFLII